VILGRTEMLTELISAGSSKDSVTAQVEHIRDATKRLTLDGRSSDFGRDGDAFDITIRREPVDIAGLVSEVADANQPLATNKQQPSRCRRRRISSPCATPTGCGRRSTICQQRHQIQPDRRQDRGSGGREHTNTMIRITDEGAGLSPEDLGRLFGRFQRLSAKPTGGESSTGLGLSIVKRIIDMHGGQVTAESAGPGRGSTFTVILPATELS
jgi:Signal transduction histidine kinase